MAWTVSVSDIAEKQLRRLGAVAQKRIVNYLHERIEDCKNPRHFGEPLTGNHSGLWRYRVGDYRIICEIQDDVLCVLTLSVGHRKEVYR